MNMLSGLTTDYVGGDNACHVLVPPGVMWDYAGSSAPSGWLLCDGSAISRTTYSGLYGVIGTTYGTGDGSTTFNLPDTRGRASVGVGQGSGLTNRVLAAKGGEETHQLVTAEMPSHRHNGMNTQWYGNSPGGATYNVWVADTTQTHNDMATTLTGSDGAHNNMPPFLSVNKIIKT
jgi:microcystin-dependent protein